MTRMIMDGERELNFVSPEEAETASVCVCMSWTFPPILPDNQRSTCADCGKALQHRPNAPKKPRKICIDCCVHYLRPN